MNPTSIYRHVVMLYAGEVGINGPGFCAHSLRSTAATNALNGGADTSVIADLWRMRADGTEPRQITNFGAMSWAPFPHPSGEYVFFTTNKLGFENFELYIVDFEGRKEPVRVTYTPGFDGLPVPDPEGRRLTWTSNRRGGGAQILLAEWNHAGALEALRKAPDRIAASAGGE